MVTADPAMLHLEEVGRFANAGQSILRVCDHCFVISRNALRLGWYPLVWTWIGHDYALQWQSGRARPQQPSIETYRLTQSYRIIPTNTYEHSILMRRLFKDLLIPLAIFAHIQVREPTIQISLVPAASTLLFASFGNRLYNCCPAG